MDIQLLIEMCFMNVLCVCLCGCVCVCVCVCACVWMCVWMCVLPVGLRHMITGVPELWLSTLRDGLKMDEEALAR